MAAITNIQVMAAINDLKASVNDLHICLNQLDKDVSKVTLEVFGNGKEGLHDKVNMLKNDYEQRRKEMDQDRAASLSLRNTMIALIIGQIISIALIVLK